MDTPEDDDDFGLFRRAMSGVRRRGGHERVHPDLPRPPPHPRFSEADEREVLESLLNEPDPTEHEHGETLSYHAPGTQHGVLRRLRRGQYRIEGHLDLHGLNRNRAQREVVEFLALAARENWRCVRIVHGKGHGSPNSGPVLKRLLDGWLRKYKAVLAFCSARPVDGGTGAVYVLLRAAR